MMKYVIETNKLGNEVESAEGRTLTGMVWEESGGGRHTAL